ncbi:hypothetical protein KGQ20_43075 [Catenulispora sp. NF23]|uniref:Uncharacterized protein n=1 Tax=Catenulispora pinistramenti TaxID=2705254 RepID=A0ABS5KVE6_9ACTN|nr:hypothetical protein [Catenulispora pinistramenti]MBS2539546.1 hypothetical protein [Catenulispora pinistramenti]MBS2550041.1 hypothetical protein [Catenulispora pinistramenti]
MPRDGSKEPDALLLQAGKFFRRGTTATDLHSVRYQGGRAGDVFYRDRWSHDPHALAEGPVRRGWEGIGS